ncbi:MAG: hypothetical protein JXB50_02555 [Spirochaetes bacterium]|nr:hypothetical protein [Spirochaetota bacterium]
MIKIKLLIIILAANICIMNINGSTDLSDDKDKIKDPVIIFELDKIKHESENPVFVQKGGMMRVGEHSFYIRTNDEWTGFSTFYIGYRYGVSKAFNIAVEGGFSAIPYVALANVLLHFKMFETKNRFLFIGTRIRTGYKYMDIDFSEKSFWKGSLGNDYLTARRNGMYIITDFTIAIRPDKKFRRHCIYYTIYPRLEIDFFDKNYPFMFIFSPIMLGYEVRYPRKDFKWSFAIEGGYFFPIPWNHVPEELWVNFPCLANIIFSYRIGDKFYSKENYKKYGLEKLPNKKKIIEKMKNYKY